MSKFKAFLKKHMLLAGGIAVLIPLIAIFYLQYRTLKTLGETLPAYRSQALVVKPIYHSDDSRKEEAQRILAVAGMVLDQEHFMTTILPDATRNSTRKF